VQLNAHELAEELGGRIYGELQTGKPKVLSSRFENERREKMKYYEKKSCVLVEMENEEGSMNVGIGRNKECSPNQRDDS
jgi:hypothetical protein